MRCECIRSSYRIEVWSESVCREVMELGCEVWIGKEVMVLGFRVCKRLNGIDSFGFIVV